MLRREHGQPVQRRDDGIADEQHRIADLQLLHVFGEVARGHRLVDLLGPGQRIELLDACLDVVARHLLTRHDLREVNPVDHGLIGLDDTFLDGYAEIALGTQHRDPESPLGPDLFLRRPDRFHRIGGVAVREHVRDSHVLQSLTSPEPPRRLGHRRRRSR
jgi:hypothetical protein